MREQEKPMAYYPHTIKHVRFLVNRAYPSSKAATDLSDKPSYILWMLEQIENMKENPTKAARWIGYAVRMAEELNLLTNIQSRELCSLDVQDGAI
jgi:hypothetical protein